MDELTQIIDFSNFILISTTIDKRDLKRLNTADNAYHIALGYCMEALHEFLAEKGESAKKTHIVFEPGVTGKTEIWNLNFGASAMAQSSWLAASF